MKDIVAILFLGLVLAGVAALTGCTTAPQLQPVKIPVPVECRETVPDRPAMPMDAVKQADTLDRKTAAALAELEVREGYEGKLRAALEGCTRPIAPAPN